MLLYISLNVCPTSMVGYITKKEGCDYGIMITASHNPYYDNGIKIFNCEGEKISELEEREIEELLKRNIVYQKKYKLGKVTSSEEYLQSYCNYLKSVMDFSYNKKVLVDVSNGVLSEIFSKVFDGKLDYTLIENSPNGKNINFNCGSEHIENLINQMDGTFSLGISFDGDGDRLVIVDQDKKIITGDDLLFLFSKELNYSKIVTTKMCNLGLIEELNRNNKEVIYSQIGDKKIYKKMKEENIYIGGEPSGHLSFLNSMLINDAMFTFIKYLNLHNKNVDYFHYVNKTINLPYNQLINMDEISLIENKINEEIKETGKVFIRKSGTEELLRINIQTKDENQYIEVKERVLNLIK